jgi:hypothetical protein
MFKLAVAISNIDARKKTLYESLKLYEIAQNNAVDDIDDASGILLVLL